MQLKHILIFWTYYRENVGRDNAVGIATRYGLDGPWIHFRRGRDFPHPSRPALALNQPPTQLVPGLSREVKRPGRVVDRPTQFGAEVKEKVKQLLYFTSGLRCLF